MPPLPETTLPHRFSLNIASLPQFGNLSHNEAMRTNALLLSSLLATATFAQSTKLQPEAIVFVCEHGAAKSVIATAYFNKLAAERGIPQRAITRGTNLDPVFAPKVIAGLPTLLTAKDLKSAQRLITFDVNPPAGLPLVQRLEWNGTPSPGANLAGSQIEIEQRVRKLIDDLAAHKK